MKEEPSPALRAPSPILRTGEEKDYEGRIEREPCDQEWRSRQGARAWRLQDIEVGRPTEPDALSGVVMESAQMTGIATPVPKLVYDPTGFRTLV
jgi:hypothetical protein